MVDKRVIAGLQLEGPLSDSEGHLPMAPAARGRGESGAGDLSVILTVRGLSITT